MQKFQNMEHSNSRTFQGLSKAWIFFQNSRTFKDPINPAKTTNVVVCLFTALHSLEYSLMDVRQVTIYE